MKINGKITEIITSRAFVSFGGFVELEGKEFEDMKNIFTYLSNAILINEEPFVDIVGSSAYFVNTEWKRKADLEIAYNNGYSDAEYKI